MSNRIIKDIIDPTTGKKIYFKNHAKATFMSDGATVEDAVINGLSEKQDTLVSGTNIKTINGESILGEGNIEISGGSSSGGSETITESDIANMGFTKNEGTITGVSVNGTSIATSGVANIPAASTSVYGVTKLSSSTNSTSTTLAATPSAVRAVYNLANGKQDALVSGTNIKTINGESILGGGNITISGTSGGSGTITGVSANGTSIATSGVADIPAASTTVYGVTKLSSSTNSTSTTLAATPSAVKAAYDLAASKGSGTITGVSVNGTSIATSGVVNIPTASTTTYGVTKLGTTSTTAATGNHSHTSLSLFDLTLGNTITPYLSIYSGTTAIGSDADLYLKIENPGGTTLGKSIKFSPSGNFVIATYAQPLNYCFLGGSSVGMYLGGDSLSNSNGKLYAGTVSATTITQTSDETLKDFKGDIEVDLDKLAQLSKKYFTWKEGGIDNDTHIGTSAQEIQKLYPEIVHDRGDGVLTLEYDKLSIIALKGIDVLYEKIKTIETRLNKLENI